MSARNTYLCDGCGAAITEAQAAQFAGLHIGQTTVASGGLHAWHSCSAGCAAQHLRSVADGIDRRGAELNAQQRRHTEDRAGRDASPGAQAPPHGLVAAQVVQAQPDGGTALVGPKASR
jgi:hypothetical protein